MSKPRRQGMRQRVVPNNKADFNRKRLKWRRSEYTDRHEAIVAEKRERALVEQQISDKGRVLALLDRMLKEECDADREVSEKERMMADELRFLRKLMGTDT